MSKISIIVMVVDHHNNADLPPLGKGDRGIITPEALIAVDNVRWENT